MFKFYLDVLSICFLVAHLYLIILGFFIEADRIIKIFSYCVFPVALYVNLKYNLVLHEWIERFKKR
ncbi:hypothetical protein AM501_00690 [Aneurinibacillus migulanus]|nr:hypothetical protein TS64_02370 [Aneurinibacillus migulanus]KPD10099.1 hypothetical protein AM501_00690 [Aneurinibacillus migulanus]